MQWAGGQGEAQGQPCPQRVPAAPREQDRGVGGPACSRRVAAPGLAMPASAGKGEPELVEMN